MVAGNRLIKEWVAYGGRVIYTDAETTVIERDEEFLILLNNGILHLTKDRIMVLIGGRRHTATIPLRGRPRRGAALKTALDVLSELPNNIVGYMLNKLPVLATIS